MLFALASLIELEVKGASGVKLFALKREIERIAKTFCFNKDGNVQRQLRLRHCQTQATAELQLYCECPRATNHLPSLPLKSQN